MNLTSLYLSSGVGAWTVISGVLALLGTIAAAFFFFRPQSGMAYTGFLKRVCLHVNFHRFVIPVILKFLYVFSALYIIISGIITIFSGSVFAGLVSAIAGPIAVRVGYELIMMLFSIHDGIRETNEILRGGGQPPRRQEMDPRYERQQPNAQYEMQPERQQPAQYGTRPDRQQPAKYGMQPEQPRQYGRQPEQQQFQYPPQSQQPPYQNRGRRTETPPEQPKSYPGGYDPLHRR